MQQASTVASSDLSSSFAGLLAKLATSDPTDEPVWNDDALADDVTTLSYERALRAHARYKPSDPGKWTIPPASDSPADGRTASAPTSLAEQAAGRNLLNGHEPGSAAYPPLDIEESRKRASVTIRMSKAECEQLHQRAAEAGLTVSAYLRSCTFEAEVLRAQVKEALAQLRAAQHGGKAPATERRTLRSWFRSIFPHKAIQANSMASA